MSGAVYRHFSASGELLYVGYSVNPFTRNKQHADQAEWFKNVSKITIEWFPTATEALAAEIEAIKRECPRENVRDMPDDLFKKRKNRAIDQDRRNEPPPYYCEKPHSQIDAINRAFGLRPHSAYLVFAGINRELENEIRESGRELMASEVEALRRSLETTFKKLDSIGIHRRNKG